jgi:hypothetical protein
MSICFFIYFFSYLFFTVDVFLSNKKPEIEIIEIISREYNEPKNRKNILKFLKNKILNSNDLFEEYNRPVKIRFKYKNYIYCMCLKFLSKRTNLKINSSPDIMLAQIILNDDTINVTEKIRELYGHSKNYYEHIPGCYNNFFFITLREYSGNTIEIMDMYGKKLKIKVP